MAQHKKAINALRDKLNITESVVKNACFDISTIQISISFQENEKGNEIRTIISSDTNSEISWNFPTMPKM